MIRADSPFANVLLDNFIPILVRGTCLCFFYLIIPMLSFGIKISHKKFDFTFWKSIYNNRRRTKKIQKYSEKSSWVLLRAYPP